MKRIRIFGMVFLLLIAVLVIDASAQTIQDIRVSNVTNAAAVVSWTTDADTTSNIMHYGDAIPPALTAEDTTVDDVHWVQIVGGLDALTTYYYSVESDGVVDDNGGAYYQFTTTKATTGSAYYPYGMVKNEDLTPAERAIVYLRVTHDGTTSHYLSVLTDAGGDWFLDLGNLKDPIANDVLSWADGDAMEIEAHGGQDGKASKSITIIDDGTGMQDTSELALPVELSSFLAISNAEGIKLKWETESETDNLGWNIYRSSKKDGKYVKVNGAMIKGAGTSATPHTYEYIDDSAKKGKRYYYYIEAIDTKGGREKSPITSTVGGNGLGPKNKLAVTWGKIKGDWRR